MSIKSISVTFALKYSNKIRVIQEAISNPTTHLKVLEGLIDIGYANALKTLHQDGRISTASLNQSIKTLPEYLQDRLNA